MGAAGKKVTEPAGIRKHNTLHKRFVAQSRACLIVLENTD